MNPWIRRLHRAAADGHIEEVTSCLQTGATDAPVRVSYFLDMAIQSGADVNDVNNEVTCCQKLFEDAWL